MPVDEARVLTVTKLNEYVKMLIDGNPVLGNVWVRGEISNLTRHGSGHLYFSLKDEGARVAAVMFRSSASALKFCPENGMKVLLHGRVSVYPRDGAYQLYATSLEPDGIGGLYVAYEQLKCRLEAEGLFRQDRKKPIPKVPTVVGVITSPTGAAVRDILNVTSRRFPLAKILLYPALVQGDGAEADLLAGIEYFSRSSRADVVIIGRGGGSIEDLWVFNSEALARAIYRSEVPVISAVGHETDFTICDFAADMRAPTPSAAAELAVPDADELKRKLGNVVTRMEKLLSLRLISHRQRLTDLAERRALTDPFSYLDDKRMELLALTRELERGMDQELKEKHHRIARLSAVLEAVSPLKVIAKGYSAVFGRDGSLIRSVGQVKSGDAIHFRTADGTVDAAVTAVSPLPREGET